MLLHAAGLSPLVAPHTARMKSRGGRAVLNARRAKGRKRLAV